MRFLLPPLRCRLFLTTLRTPTPLASLLALRPLSTGHRPVSPYSGDFRARPEDIGQFVPERPRVHILVARQPHRYCGCFSSSFDGRNESRMTSNLSFLNLYLPFVEFQQ
jgi:hypothetical protein